MTIKAIKQEANEGVVKELEALLEMAKNGEIQGFAIATMNSGANFMTGWEQGATSVLSLLGAVEMLKADLTMNGMEW